MNEHQAKRFAERAARSANEAVEMGTTSAGMAGKGMQQGYFAAVEGIRDFNVRMLEMMQANALAALDLFRDLSSAKGPAQAAAVWSSRAQQHFETITEQSKELTGLAQKVAASSTEPFTRGVGNSPFKGST
jgi:hypothetical protein